MLSKATVVRRNTVSIVRRTFSTASKEVEGGSSAGLGPIGADGRHEIWREGQSSDHDNEPRYENFKLGKTSERRYTILTRTIEAVPVSFDVP
jgi:hypothetical protein